ncbi:glycosyltransferase family 2 protein [Botrimarina mediterranea]|uniref:Undecaprenyl-phosphate mannosyltransferase n=1 Tax=Botrimarina mediterranea TaxID=2528022 RepID=A0A518K341_9BACT|nr:glycosyltransferase family 2 protein [Botrimarina mediterranea]QDV72221.1 Undecaprenyl-phosphate mannosyltransferase [Botrimarina mediterranea]QDV76765.1 Undecaprenyl-phosphate mannosyltransferase [Planctomycetes bacterium K2D]
MSLLEQLEKEVAATVATPHSAAYEPPAAEEAIHRRIERTLAEAEAALEEARRHGDLALDVPARRKTDRPVNTRLKVSVLMPVYNEMATIREIVARVRDQARHDEVLIVDDCSTDGTRDVLIELDRECDDVRVVLHGYNKGKGAALRTALSHARGDIVLVQDADLEYDPADYAKLIEPIQRGEADVVYGSRFLVNAEQDPSRMHRFGNWMLTAASNLTTGLHLTDMETCYKAMRRDALRGVLIRENRFGFEPEITAKLARRGCRFKEVPIAYNSRGWEEGKKIGPRDAFRALWCIGRYAFWD